MLTKDHLKLRVRAGRAVPLFLGADDTAALNCARDYIRLFADSEGRTFGELEELAQGLTAGPIAEAFKKLLLDTCEAEPDDESIALFRWECLAKAEAMRRAGASADATAFQQELAAGLGRDFEAVRNRLYGDLPACRRLTGFRATTPEALLQRYNVAQVQGLLLNARTVNLTLSSASLAEKRELFRQLKFHRLLAEVTAAPEEATLTVAISGPLSLFDQATAGYGLRLASFFPHVLHLTRWQLTAEVHIKRRDLTLKLDQKTGLVSHYRQRTPYVPEELTAFVDGFNQRSARWHAGPGDEFVHIGRESYCFPDLTIRRNDGQCAHFELFHKWHASQLLGRLQALEKNPLSDLFIGVSKSLAKAQPVAEALAQSVWFRNYGFLFSEFPTPKAILALLDRL